jgi:hypothetical protein
MLARLHVVPGLYKPGKAARQLNSPPLGQMLRFGAGSNSGGRQRADAFTEGGFGEFRCWHLADLPEQPINVCYWVKSGRRAFAARGLLMTRSGHDLCPVCAFSHSQSGSSWHVTQIAPALQTKILTLVIAIPLSSMKTRFVAPRFSGLRITESPLCV